MYRFRLIFAVTIKRVVNRSWDMSKIFKTAKANILARTFLVITRQLLQLERCSNPLRIQKV